MTTAKTLPDALQAAASLVARLTTYAPDVALYVTVSRASAIGVQVCTDQPDALRLTALRGARAVLDGAEITAYGRTVHVNGTTGDGLPIDVYAPDLGVELELPSPRTTAEIAAALKAEQ